MMVTSAGGRVELRQVGTNVYESADSSYTQLIENVGSLVVRTSDGTQLTFLPTSDVTTLGYRCTEVKDRNGNYLSATYDSNTGHTLTMTDTLGRVIDFNYPSGNLDTITQLWNGVAHEWARFEYQQQLVAPSFGGGLLVNGPNNQYVTVLTKVILQNLDSYSFDYNTAFGQVNRINHISPQNGLLAYTSYNVNANAGQTGCPRFTEQRDWAELWNGNWGGTPQPSEEAVTNYAVASDNSWTKVTFPDGTVYKEYYLTSGWPTGLTITTKNYANTAEADADTPRKWTTINWDQDDINLAYQKNPRPIETNVCDSSGNRRRTRIEYVTVGLPEGVNCSLPFDVFEYAADANTVLRHTYTEYYWTSDFLNRHIIGLPGTQILYDGPGTTNIKSKTNHGYDWGGGSLQDTSAQTIQHDPSYGPGFLSGRGNLTVQLRYDVTDPTNDNKVTYEVFGYDTNGSLLFASDSIHQTNIVYLDNWSDGSNHNSFAYPTQVQDPDGYWSYTQYNYNFGRLTWQQTPSPNSGQTSPSVSYTYDSATRIQQITNNVNGAYLQWAYPGNWRDIYSFSTIESGAGTTWALNARDGAGRTWATAAELPNGTGIFRIQWQAYDKMGRMTQQTNPAETTEGWVPVAEDSGG